MHAGPRERSKLDWVNAIIAVRQFESVADRSQRRAGCGAKVCYNTFTLMATRHPYSDDGAPRAVEINEEEIQKIRSVMRRTKKEGGRGRTL